MLCVCPLEVDLNDPNTKDELYDSRFVKWLIKEKVRINQFYHTTPSILRDTLEISNSKFSCKFSSVYTQQDDVMCL